MLEFQFEDLKEALEACLQRFKKDLIIKSSLNSVKELFTTGNKEYVKINNCKMGTHNALGFRILATNILAIMYKTAYREKYGEAMHYISTKEMSEAGKNYYSVADNMKKHFSSPIGLNKPALEK